MVRQVCSSRLLVVYCCGALVLEVHGCWRHLMVRGPATHGELRVKVEVQERPPEVLP